MAGDETDEKKPSSSSSSSSSPSSIPSWQQQTPQDASTPSTESSASTEASATETPSTDEPLDLLEHARLFLNDETVKNSSRERKETFLKEKGLSDAQIESLLAEEPEADLKTVHTSSSLSSSSSSSSSPSSPSSASAAAAAAATEPVPAATEPASPSETAAPQSEARQPVQSPPSHSPSGDSPPPIITYPEFLLKPEKPPPLVTVERLSNAATVMAGLSALTWGTSKFLVQPLLESLTAARHDLFTTAEQSLNTLNTKLESSVSHVPYIPPLHSRRGPAHNDHSNGSDTNDDNESIASDPTELFHRDIATQTSPPKSPTDSPSPFSGTGTGTDADRVKTTTALISDQSSKLASLHSTLSRLVSSVETPQLSETALLETVGNFQTIITSLESDINPLSRTRPLSSTFNNINTNNNSYLSSSTAATAKSTGSGAGTDGAQITRFKAEIRALKGAFLSSRSFPTIRNAAPFTLPHTNNSRGSSRSATPPLPSAATTSGATPASR